MTIPVFRAGALVLLLSTSAMAQDAFQNRVIENLQGLGYNYIELSTGPTQMKVEAVRGTEKLEVIYDLASGTILRQERERAEGEYLGRSGVEFDRDNRDFLRDDDDDDNDDRDDDDDDNGRSGSGRDDDDDDDNSGSSGGRDDDDDDGSSGSDDNDDNDDGGSSGSDDNDDDDDDN